MIRYWGQPYEGSDDEANDMIRAEEEHKAQSAGSEKTPCDHIHWNFKTHGRICSCGTVMVDPGD
jgi:hypothetical protein